MSSAPSIVEPGRPLVPRLVIAVLAALALVLGPLAALPATAAPGDPATISGTVVVAETDVSIGVTLERRFDGDPDYWEYVNSDFFADGDYSFADLEPGTYRVKSGGPSLEDGTTPYAVKESSPITLNGTDVAVAPLVLATGATISGRTTVDDADGDALSGVDVTAARFEDGRYQAERQVVTDDSGDYTVTGLRDGTYRLQLQKAGYLGEFYDDLLSDDVTDPSSGDTDGIQKVVIAGGVPVTGRDAALTPAAVVSGTVTGPQGPLQDIVASAYRKVVDNGVTRWEEFNRYDVTGEDGRYSIDLPAGSYRIGFDDQSDAYASEFFDDQPSVSSPSTRTFTVAPLDTVTADAELAPAAAISGTVTGPDDAPVYACVQAFGAGDGPDDQSVPVGDEASTDENGSYTITGLPAGSYKLSFTGCGGDYVTEYWDDQATFAAGSTVTVVGGATTDQIDAKLAAAPTTARIEGTVTDEKSLSTLSGVEARVEQSYVDDAGDTQWYDAGSDTTDSSGAYDVDVEGAGSYRVRFTDPEGVHFSEYNGDVAAADDAPSIDLVVGDVKEVDAALAPAAAITGTLKGAVGDACPTAFAVSDTAQTHPYYGSTNFSAGTYLIGELPDGDFKVRFDCGSQFGGAGFSIAATQAPQNWYLGKTSFAAANAVVGTLGSATGLKTVTIPSRVVSPPAVKKVGPSVKVSAKAGRRKATLTITVRAAGVTPTGKVTIKLGSKKLKVVTLKNGRAKVTLTKQKKGKRVYTVAYSGDKRVLARTVKTKKVAIR